MQARDIRLVDPLDLFATFGVTETMLVISASENAFLNEVATVDWVNLPTADSEMVLSTLCLEANINDEPRVPRWINCCQFLLLARFHGPAFREKAERMTVQFEVGVTGGNPYFDDLSNFNLFLRSFLPGMRRLTVHGGLKREQAQLLGERLRHLQHFFYLDLCAWVENSEYYRIINNLPESVRILECTELEDDWEEGVDLAVFGRLERFVIGAETVVTGTVRRALSPHCELVHEG